MTGLGRAAEPDALATDTGSACLFVQNPTPLAVSNTRDRLLNAAERIVQNRGLDAVSFKQLADEVGISKASVFYHFSNTEALVEALIQRCQTTYRTQYRDIVQRTASAPEKLRAIASVFAAERRDGKVCLFGALSANATTFSDARQSDVRQAAQGTIDLFARVFEQGASEGTLHFRGSAEDAAAAFLSMLQGLQVLARSSPDAVAFESVAGAYVDTLTRGD